MSENAEIEKPKEKPKYDWVTERSNCTLPIVFNTLRSQIEQHVKTRNALRPDLAPYEFSITEDIDTFTVFMKAGEIVRSVTFNLDSHAIFILDANASQMFDVTLLFTEDGRCKIKAKEESRELWQVRRMALEDLLFRTN